MTARIERNKYMSNSITVDGLVWEEPPAPKRGGPLTDWQPIADALRANVGQWARVAENAPAATAGNIRSGKMRAFAEGFEARASMLPGGKKRADIYARYVGTKAAS